MLSDSSYVLCSMSLPDAAASSNLLNLLELEEESRSNSLGIMPNVKDTDMPQTPLKLPN